MLLSKEIAAGWPNFCSTYCFPNYYDYSRWSARSQCWLTSSHRKCIKRWWRPKYSHADDATAAPPFQLGLSRKCTHIFSESPGPTETAQMASHKVRICYIQCCVSTSGQLLYTFQHPACPPVFVLSYHETMLVPLASFLAPPAPLSIAFLDSAPRVVASMSFQSGCCTFGKYLTKTYTWKDWVRRSVNMYYSLLRMYGHKSTAILHWVDGFKLHLNY
jgi:hypothetical protein